MFTNNAFTFPQEHVNENWFSRLYSRLQQLPLAMPRSNLIGFEAATQARWQRYWTRIWTLLQLIMWNKSRAAQIIILLFCFGIGTFLGHLLSSCLFVQQQVKIAMYRSFVFIILFSGLLSFGCPVVLELISDTFIILLTVLSFVVWSSIHSELPLNYFQTYHSHLGISILYCFTFLIFKIDLLIIRFYFSCIPSYISAGCLAWIVIFVTFHTRRFSIDRR